MSAPVRIYQQIEAQIKRCAPELRLTSVRRLAELVQGILASEECTVRRVAREVRAMGLRRAQPESLARRLRRTLADARLDGGAGYATLLDAAITWPQTAPVLLVLDESTTPGGVHVLRLSLTYRGSCVPVSWAVWRHQQKLPRGQYWRHLEGVLARARASIPPQLRVVVLADRAYDVPPLLDRLTALGWDWIIRVKARSKMRWRGAAGSEQPLREVVSARLDRRGRRFRLTGETFKKAGWRRVHLVGEWGHGYRDPLVVVTSLAPRWSVLSRYARRCWIEAAFRQDKSAGWAWQHSQIRDPQHQERLLLGLAWASVLVLSLGAQQAAAAVAGLRACRGRRPQPSHPRDSLFTLGLERFRAWLYGTVRGRLRWRLPRLTAPSWCAQWLAVQQAHPLSQTVLP
jgi:Transposase DDE domain